MIGRRIAVVFLFLGAVGLQAEERMRAGLWQVTTTMDGKPYNHDGNTCFTAAMVLLGNSPAATLREATEKAGAKTGCTVKDFKVDGHTMSMTQVCGARSLVISSTYGGDTFETVVRSTEVGATTVTHMKGRRVGDCK
jgi:hypothetical protein